MIKVPLKTNEKHFEAFIQYCEEYQDRFELNNYNIYYAHKQLKDRFANTRINYQSHVCTITLSREWPDRLITEKELRKCALHEICHILIIKLSFLGECRYVGEEELKEANEELTVKLESIFSKLI